jgi:hypothetical protein
MSFEIRNELESTDRRNKSKDSEEKRKNEVQPNVVSKRRWLCPLIGSLLFEVYTALSLKLYKNSWKIVIPMLFETMEENVSIDIRTGCADYTIVVVVVPNQSCGK